MSSITNIYIRIALGESRYIFLRFFVCCLCFTVSSFPTETKNCSARFPFKQLYALVHSVGKCTDQTIWNNGEKKSKKNHRHKRRTLIKLLKIDTLWQVDFGTIFERGHFIAWTQVTMVNSRWLPMLTWQRSIINCLLDVLPFISLSVYQGLNHHFISFKVQRTVRNSKRDFFIE